MHAQCIMASYKFALKCVICWFPADSYRDIISWFFVCTHPRWNTVGAEIKIPVLRTQSYQICGKVSLTGEISTCLTSVFPVNLALFSSILKSRASMNSDSDLYLLTDDFCLAGGVDVTTLRSDAVQLSALAKDLYDSLPDTGGACQQCVSFCLSVCACVCLSVCMSVCVRERERERERGKDGKRDMGVG